jgi:hypothetical protein
MKSNVYYENSFFYTAAGTKISCDFSYGTGIPVNLDIGSDGVCELHSMRLFYLQLNVAGFLFLRRV